MGCGCGKKAKGPNAVPDTVTVIYDDGRRRTFASPADADRAIAASGGTARKV